jgi:hypothetical protein
LTKKLISWRSNVTKLGMSGFGGVVPGFREGEKMNVVRRDKVMKKYRTSFIEKGTNVEGGKHDVSWNGSRTGVKVNVTRKNDKKGDDRAELHVEIRARTMVGFQKVMKG